MPIRIGLLYEDENVRIVFTAIARKILGEDTEFVEILGGSWPGIKGEIRELLQVLSVKHLTSPMDKVFVVVDSNGADPRAREEGLRQKIGNRTYRFASLNFYAIKRQSETLLLADPQAINQAAGANIPPMADPETLPDAKRYLIQQLKNSGREFTREFVRNAAANLSIERLGRACREFARLKALLEDC